MAGKRVAEAVIVGAMRTPVGKQGGALSPVRPNDLAALALDALMERTGVPPEEVGGTTINRLCGSGLDAAASAARAIRSPHRGHPFARDGAAGPRSGSATMCIGGQGIAMVVEKAE